jgi:tetratricopeptide (TPR) repeat protein
MGTSFSGELVARVLEAEDPSASPDAEAWDRLTEFLERDPYTPGAFRFRHALFRDAAYEGLAYRRRRELHASVGRAYESLYAEQLPEHAEVLALHFFHAEDHDKTYHYSLLAGERAREKYANIEAAAFYRRALDSARNLPDVDASAMAKVWEALGDVCELAGRYDEAAEAYRQARRVAESVAGEQPALLHKEGLIRERSSRYPEALRWYRRALAAAERLEDGGVPSRITLEVRLAYAGVRFRQGEFADCIEWCNQVVEQALPISDLEALAHAYYLLHLAYTSMGSPDRIAFRGLALPIYEELGDLLGQANVLNNLGIDAYYEGRWEEALDVYGRSQEARERIGDVVGAATIANNVGEIKSDQGHYEAAEALFRETDAVCTRAGSRFLATLARSNLGRLAARTGRFDEAGELLHEALASFEEMKAGSFVLETKARLAEYAVLSGDPAAGLPLAEETLRAVDESGAGGVLRAMLHRVRAYALMQSGGLDAAEEAVEESIRTARAGDEAYELALSLDALVRLSSLQRADGGGASDERESIFEQLGVIARPYVPLRVEAAAKV